MPKKKKKKNRLPYVHIDVIPEEESLPDEDIEPQEDQPSPQNDPRNGAKMPAQAFHMPQQAQQHMQQAARQAQAQQMRQGPNAVHPNQGQSSQIPPQALRMQQARMQQAQRLMQANSQSRAEQNPRAPIQGAQQQPRTAQQQAHGIQQQPRTAQQQALGAQQQMQNAQQKMPNAQQQRVSSPQSNPRVSAASQRQGAKPSQNPRQTSGWEQSPSEVISASEAGLKKRKATSKAKPEPSEDPDIVPFVIPVFKKAEPKPAQSQSANMGQMLYGSSNMTSPAQGPSASRNLAQIQQNFFARHNVAQGAGPGQGTAPMQMQQQHSAHGSASQQPSGQFPRITQGMASGSQAPAAGTMQAVAAAAAARASQTRMNSTLSAAQSRAPMQGGALSGSANAAPSPNPSQSQPHPIASSQTQQTQQSQAAAQQSQSSEPASEKASEAAESSGKPLLDSKSMEDSPMFDEPPVSIEEGMRKSEKGRKSRRRVIIIAVIVVVLALAGSGAYLMLSNQGVVPRITIETKTVPVTSQDSESGSSAGSSSAAGASGSSAASEGGASGTNSGTGSGDLSGTVVYQYTANTASGVEYKVEETVTFQSNGDCVSSTMDMTFPDEASAKTFTDNLARDYGSSFKLDSLNGTNAIVTIDNSGLHLTRDEYENALRYSVTDLVVVGK